MSQKIPLFDGIIQKVGDPVGATQFELFTPPDKNLTPGSQAFYQVFLWVFPSGPVNISVYQGTDQAGARSLWVGDPATAEQPIQLLDGVPLRGDVTLQGTFEAADPDNTQVFGYYVRVGESTESAARRFIGEDPVGNTFAQGRPIAVPPGERRVVHTFEDNRIDEVSLAIAPVLKGAVGEIAGIRFEDAAGNLLPDTTEAALFVGDSQDTDPYRIKDAVFGGAAGSSLAQIAVAADAGNTQDFLVHGYFTRR